MTTTSNIFITAVIASLIAGAAAAQTARVAGAEGTAFGNTNQVEDLQEDLADEIEEDAERDVDRFGNEGRSQGFSGSFALRGSATSGNDETADLGIGANFGYVAGPNGYDLGLYYSFSQSENDAGDLETNEDSLLYDLEYTRDITPVLYGFAKLQGSYNGDDDEGDDLERENDVFLGFGAGYRIYNTPEIVWSVQAGPGYRFSNFSDITETVTDFDDDDISEAAFAVSSNYFNKFSDSVALTNDTDVITSESDTVVYNDLGVNVAMNRSLALRTSIQTEYHSDPAPDEDHTDNTFGVSLVYSFN